MANEACDACLIDQFGFLASGSYPYSLSYDPPDRIYCVGGVPVVPPARGPFAPVGGSYNAQPVSTVSGSVALAAADSTMPAWVNTTGRSARALATVDGYMISSNTYLALLVTLSCSGGSSSPLSIPVISTGAFSDSGLMTESINGGTGVLTVNPGESLSMSVSGSTNPLSTFQGSTGAVQAIFFTMTILGGYV